MNALIMRQHGNKVYVFYTKKALKDIQHLKSANLADKVLKLCEILVHNPVPLHSKQLSGDLKKYRSIRINLKHRLVYEVHPKEKTIKILSMWNHYTD